ncbi:MAG: phosphatidylglycerophosphatase A [Alphaproteobacteria bacterium]|nr:phosphatidylglycerophosphatase A [Alphaproteobacteria bacterium]
MRIGGNPILARHLAGMFGIGAMTRFHGTAASLVALGLGWMIDDAVGRGALAVAAVAVFVAGLWANTLALRDATANGRPQQPERMVIADAAGMLLTLLAVPFSPAGYLLSFLAFRLFHAARPWPIHWYDFGIGRGGGVMLDAALAALGSGAIVFASAWALGEMS